MHDTLKSNHFAFILLLYYFIRNSLIVHFALILPEFYFGKIVLIVSLLPLRRIFIVVAAFDRNSKMMAVYVHKAWNSNA